MVDSRMGDKGYQDGFSGGGAYRKRVQGMGNARKEPHSCSTPLFLLSPPPPQLTVPRNDPQPITISAFIFY